MVKDFEKSVKRNRKKCTKSGRLKTAVICTLSKTAKCLFYSVFGDFGVIKTEGISKEYSFRFCKTGQEVSRFVHINVYHRIMYLRIV